MKEYKRPETTVEYEQRIRLDAITCRHKLVEHGFRPPTILAWPYGEANRTPRNIHEAVGVTHFCSTTRPRYWRQPKAPGKEFHACLCCAPTETIPLAFPKNVKQMQRWWLVFLKVARDSQSIPLISATLDQLTSERRNHPEAEISRAVADYLKGDAAAGTERLIALREPYPLDPVVTQAIDNALKQFNSRPL